MFEIMVEKHFASAHHLLNYKGKCERPHGHNYVVQVFAQKETLDKANVCIDYTHLKELADAHSNPPCYPQRTRFPGLGRFYPIGNLAFTRVGS